MSQLVSYFQRLDISNLQIGDSKSKTFEHDWVEYPNFWLLECEQKSAKWLKERQGRITGSNFANVRGFGFLTKKQLYREIKGLSKKKFTKEEKRRIDYGVLKESEARNYYIETTKNQVLEVGFGVSKRNNKIGASPDGIVVKEGKWLGMIEIKCPEFYPKSYPRKVPENDGFIYSNHYDQIQGSLLIFGLPWCDYVVYSSDFQLIYRVDYNSDYAEKLFLDIEEFINDYGI